MWTRVCATSVVTQAQRDGAWGDVRAKVEAHATRPFCRNETDGRSGLNVPVQRPFADQDWRFHRPNKTTMI